MDNHMKAQRDPADPGEIGAQLLRSVLAGRNAVPSPLLEALFAMAARLPAARDPELISTERLLPAIRRVAEGMADPDVTSTSERAALMAVAEILASRWEQLQGREELHEEPSPQPATRGLSKNVHACLIAASNRKTGVTPRPPVGADDFLATFPPPQSIAAKMLRAVGINLDAIRESVERASEATISTESTVSSATSGAEGAEGADPAAEAVNAGGDVTGERIPPAEKKEPGSRDAAGENERVGTHCDEPATADALGRLAFAQVLADRITEARQDAGGGTGSFVVHLHGPWGSGKSSLLNFLESDLRSRPEKWVVVKFNAWRDQRLQPPWWSLIQAIYSQARSQLRAERSAQEPAQKERKWLSRRMLVDSFWRTWAGDPLWRKWLVWKARADYLPMASVASCLLLIGLLIYLGLSDSISGLISVIASALTLIGAVYIGSRTLAFGSQRAAQAYAEGRNDPYKPISDLFSALIKVIGRPVIVFVDDLDRCDSDYVVSLLEGIQTLMRGESVTYVVAADRKWICSSFEQRFAGFSAEIGDPGRPLGYLFLEKIFQISAPIPQLATNIKSEYWRALLKDGTQQVDHDRLEKEAESATLEAANYNTQEQLTQMLERAEQTEEPAKILATRAAAARRITSREATAKTEHRLQPFAGLIEPNPRAMKRLVNAYGMQQAILMLSGRKTAPGVLARWTILCLRWPRLADYLTARPAAIKAVGCSFKSPELVDVDESLRSLFSDEEVLAVVGRGTDPDRLDSASLNALIGMDSEPNDDSEDRRR